MATKTKWVRPGTTEANVTRGMDISNALLIAAHLGCKVTKQGNNDRRCSHPLMPRPCIFSDHRDSSPRHFTVWLKRLAEKKQKEALAGTAAVRKAATPAPKKTVAKPTVIKAAPKAAAKATTAAKPKAAAKATPKVVAKAAPKVATKAKV